MSFVGVCVTSIYPNAPALKKLDDACEKSDKHKLYVAGDTISPEFNLNKSAKYLSISSQLDTNFSYAKKAPVRNYCRKNIAYLEAIKDGAYAILETDDDNYPIKGFFNDPQLNLEVNSYGKENFTNVYPYFLDDPADFNPLPWPRGFAIEHIANYPDEKDCVVKKVDCPIQSFLVDQE